MATNDFYGSSFLNDPPRSSPNWQLHFQYFFVVEISTACLLLFSFYSETRK